LTGKGTKGSVCQRKDRRILFEFFHRELLGFSPVLFSCVAAKAIECEEGYFNKGNDRMEIRL
jgi:hypothetical protein